MLRPFLLAEQTPMSTYKQLTYEQRCHIYQLNKIDWSQKAIANNIVPEKPGEVSQNVLKGDQSRIN